MRQLAFRLFSVASGASAGFMLRHRLLVVGVAQLALILFANACAFLLRFEGRIPPPYQQRMWQGMPFVALVYWAGLWGFSVHRGLWRYVGLHDLARIFWASVVSTAGLFAVFHPALGWFNYPRSVIILTGLLSLGLLAGIRLAIRWLRGEWLQIVEPTACRVLVVGAGKAGELLVLDLQANPAHNYRPVAFVDDDPVKQKAAIHDVPVLGTIADIGKAAETCAANEIILAIPSATPKLMQKILAASEACHLPIRTLPNVKQLLDGAVSMRRVRPLSLEDLLQREPIQTDLQELHPLLEGKSVLVTGAGGSIGSELCRQIARYRPARLVLFERHENSLYALDLELRETFPQVTTLAVVGDVTNAQQVETVFRACAPNLIFHAAAHKHVPMMEQNQGEAIRNNVMGTRTVGEAALAAGVGQFVLISTDKAVNPTSVMGVTKRIAEFLAQDLNRRNKTRFTVVRFGNVLGSNGSVVPLFTEQIRRGGPVTVTHPEIKRFFMTIPEAVQLVLQASVLGRGGDVFVLDMGEQIRVVDLARNMIVLSGHVPDQDIKITFTGLRPGEKLYEELFDGGERVEPTAHAKIKRAVGLTTLEGEGLVRHVRELEALLDGSDPERLTRKLQEMVPNYNRSTCDAAK
ncbi:MAG: nucleoside-diphosphate sugar epimerase/dehydratase [Nitrospirales bacterium]|nr:nucleoside-diphosphate sugar epimerase/dehydratase [Nitrospirales bacterium]